MMQPQDIFKFLHQSAFGCEHLVSSQDKAKDYIEREFSSAMGDNSSIEALDGNYCRVPLSYLSKGLKADTFAKLFVLSSKKEADGLDSLLRKIACARELVKEGTLPFSVEEFEKAIIEWASKGYEALHHSEIFRQNYKPSYRVISKDYIPFLPLFCEIDKRLCKERLVIAIEGGSASGKSTLGALIEKVYDCTVFHMDDFFLRKEQRTPERLKEIGGNIDHERFLEEVLLPLGKGEEINYQRFDCRTFSLCKGERIAPKNLVIVEGAYSMHPSLAEHYDFSVFLDVSPKTQMERILVRNTPPLANRFFTEWIPLENIYFEKTDVKSRCGLVIGI